MAQGAALTTAESGHDAKAIVEKLGQKASSKEMSAFLKDSHAIKWEKQGEEQIDIFLRCLLSKMSPTFAHLRILTER